MSPSRKKAPKTRLQALFMKRVQEELDARGLSRSAITKRVGGPSQSTFNEVMNGSDPRLATVEQIAAAIGIQPWELFTERTQKASGHVRSLQAYPSMMGQADKAKSSSKHSDVADRKKRRG